MPSGRVNASRSHSALGLQMGALMSGAVVTEQIFVVPGFGRLIVEAVFTRDYPVVQAVVLITASAYVLINLLVDVSYSATPTYIRLTRGLVLSVKEEDYVHGARALGAGDVRLMGRHILPNIVSALLVQATVQIPTAIIAEAVLSFLGPGVQPPAPSWGTMLNAAQQFLESAPWMAFWPGLAIFVLALSFNLAGDGLRDLLDPRDY